MGVVKPTRYRELAEPRPTLYLPAPQFIVAATTLVLRTTLPPERVAELARAAVSAVDPERQVTRLASFAELAGEHRSRGRASTRS